MISYEVYYVIIVSFLYLKCKQSSKIQFNLY